MVPPRSARVAVWLGVCRFRSILGLTLVRPVVGGDAAGLPSVVAERSLVTQERSFDGIVEAERRSTVSSQVAARIEEVPFDVDDYVERGDIIVQFRNLPAAADLKQAEAAAQEAQATAR